MEKTYVDKDFYAYDVVVRGTLEINLTHIPSNCDYDLRVYQMDNSDLADSRKMDFNSSSYLISANGGNSDEKIKIDDVTPGTYYIVVYSYKDASWDNDHSYSLSFEQELLSDNLTYYDISSGRKSGDKCAVWESDYKPLGYRPLTLKETGSKIKAPNYKCNPFIKNFCEADEKKYVTYAKLYIWDLEIRESIYRAIEKVIETLQSDFDKYNELSDISTSLTDKGLFLSASGLVIAVYDAVNLVAEVSEALSVVSIATVAVSIAVSIASKFVCNLMSSIFSAEKAELLQFLINAKAGLEVGRGTSDSEVVVIKYRYYVGYQGVYYMDCSPSYKNYGRNLYDKNYIDVFDDDSPIPGTIHGFKNESQIRDFL